MHRPCTLPPCPILPSLPWHAAWPEAQWLFVQLLVLPSLRKKRKSVLRKRVDKLIHSQV